jgi:hypothetical protein
MYYYSPSIDQLHKMTEAAYKQIHLLKVEHNDDLKFLTFVFGAPNGAYEIRSPH